MADGVDVLRTYCETTPSHRPDKSLLEEAREQGEQIRVDHLEKRARSESDWFGSFVNLAPDYSNPTEIPGGSINDEKYYDEIKNLDPDLLVAYGCSLIKDPLLSEYEGRFLNVHLGLSPYYRGTGTNFWPLVNGEPEYVGATFMHIDEGVDTGEIIHQLRARVHPSDGPHDIGNRLISDVGQIYPELARSFDELHSVDQPPEPDEERYYRSDDYNPEATKQLYTNFENGLVADYLDNWEERTTTVPIVKHPVINEADILDLPEIFR